MDITPMIDITFLLLIFFIVCSTVAQAAGVKLPKAKYGTAVDAGNAYIITVDDQGTGGKPTVTLDKAGDGNGPVDVPSEPNIKTLEQEIEDEVDLAFKDGKSLVLIKAAKTVKHGEVSRVAGAAAEVEGIQLHMAVLEGR